MGQHIVNWAARAEVSDAYEKAVLLVLADAADGATASTFIGHDTISERSKVSPRTVIDVLRRLEKDGWIVRKRRYVDGFRTSDLTTLTLRAATASSLPAPAAPKATVLPAAFAPKDGSLPAAERKPYLRRPQGITQIITQNKINTSTTLKPEMPKPTRAPSADVGFEALWTAYPSHGAAFPKMSRGRSKKPKALTEWHKLSVDDRSQLEGAVAEYARSAEAKKDGGQWVPAFERWIRDETWRAFVPASEGTAATNQPVQAGCTPVNWSERLEMWVSGRWNSADWGPRPNEAGCRAPPDVLARHGFGPQPFSLIQGGAA